MVLLLLPVRDLHNISPCYQGCWHAGLVKGAGCKQGQPSGHSRSYASLIVYDLWSKWWQTRMATSLSWNKQNYAEYLLKKDVKRDKLLVVLIVVTLLCLIVWFFRMRLCKMNDTILRFQCVGFRCISYFSRFFHTQQSTSRTTKVLSS